MGQVRISYMSTPSIERAGPSGHHRGAQTSCRDPTRKTGIDLTNGPPDASPSTRPTPYASGPTGRPWKQRPGRSKAHTIRREVSLHWGGGGASGPGLAPLPSGRRPRWPSY
ncbi:hypothetical protein GCM10020220_110680 [Nonomuraea rubra]